MAKEQLHRKLVRHREAAGLKRDAAAVYAEALLPGSFSREKLHRLENPAHQAHIPEDRADPLELAALASVYGCRVADLSESAAAQLDRVTELIATCRCTVPSPVAA